MKIRTIIFLLVSHSTVAALGFAIGIYMLPILIEPPAPGEQVINQVASTAKFVTEFKKDLKDSDTLHWGQGKVFISNDHIALKGTLAPGPDYKLYLSPDFVETEADFMRIKSTMVRVADIQTFNNFVIKLPTNIDPTNYSSVIIWCEAFSQFITAARYQ